MNSISSSVFQALLRALVPLGIDVTFGKRHTLARWLLALVSLLLVISAFAWGESNRGSMDILAAISQGAPAWLLISPLLGVLSILAIWWNAPGIYLVLALPGLPMAFVLIYGWQMCEAIPGFLLGWGGLLAIFAWMIHSLVAIVAAMGQAVPLTSPMARVLYLGRYGHMRSVLALAEKWGWQTKGPEGRTHALSVSGRWGERDALIESAQMMSTSAHGQNYHMLTITVSSKKALWTVYLGMGELALDKKDRLAAQQIACQTSGSKEERIYVFPPDGQPLVIDTQHAVQGAFNGGRRFVRKNTQIRTYSNAIRFRRISRVRMTENEEDMEAILQWLANIARVLEDRDLAVPFEEDIRESDLAVDTVLRY